jgi:PAS domain S-box-containing protein
MIDDGRIVFANPRTSEILGYTPGELNGRIALELVAEADREDVGRMLQAVASGQVKVIERNISGLHKDGSLVDIGARATLAILDNKPMILAVAQDIGERKKAQEEIQRYVSRLEQAMMTTVEAVSTMVELRDPYTAGHERRVGELAAALGSEMGLPEETVTGLRMTGYVHDIGKISIPAEILSKPGRLTAIEYELVKNHSRSGYDILKSVEFPWPLAEIILQHHERMDGSGYPQQLKGEQIILEARIMAVADVVESMASHRPYRPALGLDKALEEIEQNSGRLYYPQVADACLRLFRQRSYRIPD